MGFFSKILSKLGMGSTDSKVDQVSQGRPAPAAPAAGATPVNTGTMGAGAAAPATTPTSPANPMAEVDVVSLLEAKATASSEKLNWKTSIVDLLKLLDLDSSLAARKELATELNVRAGADGSAEQNSALHKAVLAKIAANGGNVPKELLD